MNKYSLDDFSQYWRDTYVRLPTTGQTARVLGADRGAVAFENRSVPGAVSYIPLDQFEWEHVKLPRLGYRNTAEGGRGLYHFVRKVGRIATKGLSNATVRVERVTEVYDALCALKLDAEKYALGARVDQATANSLHLLSFMPLPDAISLLKTKHDAVGYALSPEFAIVLGSRQDNALTLLWKQIAAAISPDGAKWHVLCDEYKEVIFRQFGKI